MFGMVQGSPSSKPRPRSMPIGPWRPIEFLQQPHPLERAGHAAVVDGSCIYVIGGRKGRAFFNDILIFNSVQRTWENVKAENADLFEERGNHTATLIGRDIWVLGGSNNDTIFSDVCVFNLDKRAWRFPQLKENAGLLCRSAHGADVHPRLPNSIVVMGGYGGISSTYVWNNDTIILHTDRLYVESVVVQGQRPSPRGYHSFTTLGPYCFAIGGRTEEGRIQGRQMVAVFDPASGTWHTPTVHATGGDAAWPPARSSHRAVALQDRIVIHGGAAKEGDPDRLADVATLLVPSGPAALTRLEWSACDQPTAGPSGNGHRAAQPQGRAAHTASLVGCTMFILCGYTGNHAGGKYVGDCWALDLPARAAHGHQHAGTAQRHAAASAAHAVPFVTKPSTRAAAGKAGTSGRDTTAAGGATAGTSGSAAAAEGTGRQRERTPPPGGSGRSGPSPPPPSGGSKREHPGGGSGGTAAAVGLPAKRQAVEPAGPGPPKPGSAPELSPPGAACPGGLARASSTPLSCLTDAGAAATAATTAAAGAAATAAAAAALAQQQQQQQLSNVAGLEQELASLRGQLQQQANYKNYQLLEVELKHLREQRAQLQHKLEAAEGARADRDKQIADLQTQLMLRDKELQGCQTMLAEREQSANATAALNQHVSHELATMRERNTQLQAAVATLEARLEDRTRDLEQKLEERSKDLETARATSTSLQALLASRDRSMEVLDKRLQDETAALASERSRAAEQVEHSRNKLREQEAAHEATRADLRTAQTRLASSEGEKLQLRTDLIEAQARAKTLEESSSRADAELRTLHSELAAARQQVAELTEVARVAQDMHRQISSVLRDSNGSLFLRPGLAGAGSLTRGM